MLAAFFFLELDYRKVRPTTYVYFVLIFLVSYLVVTGATLRITNAAPQTSMNAPYAIALITVVLSFIFSIVTSAIVSVSILRDVEHGTEPLLFSTPITKQGYLLGRFLGSIVVALLVYSGIWLGLMAGYWTGHYLPWEVTWDREGLLPFNAWHFFHPFLLFGFTNIISTGALFFISGALARNTLVIYLQGVLVVILYLIGITFLDRPGEHYWAALVDPFGYQTFLYSTRYWTAAEQNNLVVPVEGVVLYNRLLWCTIGAAALVLTYRLFSFDSPGSTIILRDQVKQRSTGSDSKPVAQYGIYSVATGGVAYLRQLMSLAWNHFMIIWRERPFLVIVASGFLLVISQLVRLKGAYGTLIHPDTGRVLAALNSFNLFFLIITIYYSGELIWKERETRVATFLDALPVPSVVHLISKFLALVLVLGSLFILLGLAGIVIQRILGQNPLHLLPYVGVLLFERLYALLLLCIPMFIIQILVNNKFLGFTLTVGLLLLRLTLDRLGVEHGLWQYGSGTLGAYSDMAGFTQSVSSFIWFRSYWTALAAALLFIAVLFYPRGYDVAFLSRWRNGKMNRMKRPLVIFSLGAFLVFILCGFYIYYNTSIVNQYETPVSRIDWRVSYERTLKAFDRVWKPYPSHIDLTVNIFPRRQEFSVKGYYWLKNDSHLPQSNIHVQENPDRHIAERSIRFSEATTIERNFASYQFTVYAFNNPLLPGDSIRMDFEFTYKTEGFEGPGNTPLDVVANGTYISSTYFPRFGYQRDFEVTGREIRRKWNLPEGGHREGVAATARSSIHILVSTSIDQVAVAPGLLVNSWTTDDRVYFEYRQPSSVSTVYGIASAQYEVHREEVGATLLEVFIHPGHTRNGKRMLDAMKNAFVYSESNFGAYPLEQIRIVEVPHFQTAAAGFAGTVLVNETLVGTTKVPGSAIDLIQFEVGIGTARQWWEQELIVCDRPGKRVLTEGLSRYTALMVVQQQHGSTEAGKFLRYEMDGYLRDRKSVRQAEGPLIAADDTQAYLFQRKGPLAFYALQDLAGEHFFNGALRKFLTGEPGPSGPCATAADLVATIHSMIPDSLGHLVDDYFNRITLFENKVLSSGYKSNADGTYEATLVGGFKKMDQDSLGHEIELALNDWIDIGVYSRGPSGDYEVVYLKKHHITRSREVITITLPHRPLRLEIDPRHLCIDRQRADNVAVPREYVDINSMILEF